MLCEGAAEALGEAKRLLDAARAAGRPVIHIQHDAGVGTPYDINAPIGRIADLVRPEGDELVIVKNYPNSFAQTDLHEKLQAMGGTKELVLAGFMTHMCVNSTARAAFELGYRCTVVADATATRALPSKAAPGGTGVVGAKALKEATLSEIEDMFAVVVPTVDDLKQ